MHGGTGYQLALDSELFRVLCRHLNDTVEKEGAASSVDIMSGSFKFSDEVPRLDDPGVVLPLATLMRCLWAYRQSLIEGSPRPEFAGYWEQTRKFAPRWAGFNSIRCGQDMKPLIDVAKIRVNQFARDAESLETHLSARG